MNRQKALDIAKRRLSWKEQVTQKARQREDVSDLREALPDLPPGAPGDIGSLAASSAAWNRRRKRAKLDHPDLRHAKLD
jgi:hypothetical protein